MAATIFKSATATDLEFGVEDETGIIMTNYTRDVSTNKTEVMDGDGEVVAVAHTNKTASLKFDGYVNGSSGINIAAIMTVLNDTDDFGLTGGTIIVDGISSTKAQGEFTQVSVDATQYLNTLS